MARSMRKVRTGSVVRAGQEKTTVVEMVWKQRHRIYGKQMRRVARFQVHDPENQCRLGDVVRIEETRPISKTKHWRLLEILQRRQVADVAPIELESDAVIVEPEVEAPNEASVADNSGESEGAPTGDESEGSSDDVTPGEPADSEGNEEANPRDELAPPEDNSVNEDGR